MNIKSLPLQSIIEDYPLPNRLLSYYAAQIAKEFLLAAPNCDKVVSIAVELTERYGLGEDFEPKYLDAVLSEVLKLINPYPIVYSPYGKDLASTHQEFFYVACAAYEALSGTFSRWSASHPGVVYPTAGTPHYGVATVYGGATRQGASNSAYSVIQSALSVRVADIDKLEVLLFKCIKERMSRVEQLLILGEEL